MKKGLLILLCLPMIGFGQNVNIPDANFEMYIATLNIPQNGTPGLQFSEAAAYSGEMHCYGHNISDLTGIEAFTNLTVLNCSNNPLGQSLDLSANTALTTLRCHGTSITNLDISGATALTYLDCNYNNLTTLDVSQNTALNQLECRSNKLTSLDVSQNTALTRLACHQNQLTSLDFRNGNNINVSAFKSSANLYLTCINVDDSAWSTIQWTLIDAQQYFSTNCNPSSIQELNTNKELLKVTNLLGRETKGTKNEVLFYIYDDGTVEKRIVIE